MAAQQFAQGQLDDQGGVARRQGGPEAAAGGQVADEGEARFEAGGGHEGLRRGAVGGGGAAECCEGQWLSYQRTNSNARPLERR